MTSRGMCAREVGECGGAVVELVLLAPALMLVVGFIAFTGRLALTTADVRHAAAAAARAASVTQTPAAATAAANDAVDANLTASACIGADVDIDANMQPGSTVNITVDCPVALSDLIVLGFPGARTITARAVEPIDLYRASGGGDS